ncbi:protein CROC-4 isoform X5 [Theropithecus gelada]|uniref:protein CROC-4 isoform X5 n=1 Tax=Theropithecus gelada TaxID=9565 RepID=UPI000DC16F95|nr:protein CROC-4 isoform X5 [Theropithecus gelada]
MGTLGSIFSPGAGGCSNTLPPSFLLVDDRATSSTTDSSRAHWKLRVLPSAGHIGKEAGACSVSGQGNANQKEECTSSSWTGFPLRSLPN